MHGKFKANGTRATRKQILGKKNEALQIVAKIKPRICLKLLLIGINQMEIYKLHLRIKNHKFSKQNKVSNRFNAVFNV